MNIDLRTWDVGAVVSSPKSCVQHMVEMVQSSWANGADVVLFPEYSWMSLERFVPDQDKLAGVAALFWETLWPELQALLSAPGKAVVFGTAPWIAEDGSMRNRAPILCEGVPNYQDKIFLTPWETGFTGGREVRLFTLHGITFAVVICLDIEIPELSAALRGKGVDAILVPSATESLMGVDRIGRCASARAIELGCYVGIAHLVGKTVSELVDDNVGRLGWFAPAQLPFANLDREHCTPVFHEGFEHLRVHLDKRLIEKMRARRLETNPALLTMDGGVDLGIVRPG